MKTAKTPAIKVTRCKEWPNKIGFDCTVNGTRFEVVNDRQIGRLVALRRDRIDGFTHSVRICDDRAATWVEGNRDIAELVYLMWRDRRDTWVRHTEI